MNNLKSLSKLSDAEYLSFLYAERERNKSKESKSGWSIWAIIGSVFALICYTYNLLKTRNDDVDIALCYYIVCAFLPPILYSSYLVERYKGFENGDSRHVGKIGDVAPLGFLCFIGGTNLLLVIWGLYCDSFDLVVYTGIVLFPIFFSIVLIFIHRKKYVTTFDRFAVSNISWLNKIMNFIICGAIILPLNCARQKLSFGFSLEFELAISFVILVILTYLLSNLLFAKNKEKCIDQIIDGYLFRDWSKEFSILQYEKEVLGARPTDELQSVYDRLVFFETMIPDILKRFEEKEKMLKNECISKSELKQLTAEIDSNIKTIDDLLRLYNDILNRTKELLDLKTIVADKDFVVMLDLLMNKQTFEKIHSQSVELQNRMSSCMKTAMEKSKLSMCLKTECPYRKRN